MCIIALQIYTSFLNYQMFFVIFIYFFKKKGFPYFAAVKASHLTTKF